MLKLAAKDDEVDMDKLLIIACLLTKRLKMENYVGATALVGGCGYTGVTTDKLAGRAGQVQGEILARPTGRVAHWKKFLEPYKWMIRLVFSWRAYNVQLRLRLNKKIFVSRLLPR